MRLYSWISSLVMPTSIAVRTQSMRSARGVARWGRIASALQSSGLQCGLPGTLPKPLRPVSRPRRAFCIASLKVRPIAMTSPTDFICVVSTESAVGNFSNAQRGNLTTQ